MINRVVLARLAPPVLMMKTTCLPSSTATSSQLPSEVQSKRSSRCEFVRLMIETSWRDTPNADSLLARSPRMAPRRRDVRRQRVAPPSIFTPNSFVYQTSKIFLTNEYKIHHAPSTSFISQLIRTQRSPYPPNSNDLTLFKLFTKFTD